MVTRKQARLQQLPPTQAGLHQAVLRAHYRKAELTCTDLCGCLDTGEDCKNRSVDANDDDCKDEDDDVDDEESKYEYISDSDGEFN